MIFYKVQIIRIILFGKFFSFFTFISLFLPFSKNIFTDIFTLSSYT